METLPENAMGTVPGLGSGRWPWSWYPSLTESCVKGQGLWVRKAVRGIQQHRKWNVLISFVCIWVSNWLYKTNDSIFFHSFLNPFLCFYPLYLLFCFVLERDSNTDFQEEESLESLLLQVMARSHSPPIILDVSEAGAKCDKCQQMNRLA